MIERGIHGKKQERDQAVTPEWPKNMVLLKLIGAKASNRIKLVCQQNFAPTSPHLPRFSQLENR